MKKQKILSSFIASLFIITSIFLAGCKNKNSQNLSGNITAGFYNLDSYVQNGIKNVLTNISQSEQFKITFVELTDESLEDNKKTQNINIIFTEAGYSLQKVLKQKNAIKNKKEKVKLDSELLAEMTNSMQQSAVYEEKKLAAVPLLINCMELFTDVSALRSLNYEDILNWKDFNDFAKKTFQTSGSPITFGGNDSVFFMDLIGAFCESFDGENSYNKALKIIQNAANQKEIDYIQLTDELVNYADSPLYNTIFQLRNMYKDGLIANFSFEILPENLEQFCRDREQKLFFMNLSTFRSLNQNYTKAYSSIFVPSDKAPGTRQFTANVNYAVSVNLTEQAKQLINLLTSNQVQEKLSRATGLAPVSRNCQTPDIQASDVRYWIAATKAPSAGLGHEAPLTKDQLTQLSKNLQALIKYGK